MKVLRQHTNATTKHQSWTGACDENVTSDQLDISHLPSFVVAVDETDMSNQQTNATIRYQAGLFFLVWFMPASIVFCSLARTLIKLCLIFWRAYLWIFPLLSQISGAVPHSQKHLVVWIWQYPCFLSVSVYLLCLCLNTLVAYCQPFLCGMSMSLGWRSVRRIAAPVWLRVKLTLSLLLGLRAGILQHFNSYCQAYASHLVYHLATYSTWYLNFKQPAKTGTQIMPCQM